MQLLQNQGVPATSIHNNYYRIELQKPLIINEDVYIKEKEDGSMELTPPGEIAKIFPFFKISTHDLTVPGDTFIACEMMPQPKNYFRIHN